MKVLLDSVPYYSQFTDVKNVEWKNRACTIACLKMAMEYSTGQSMPSIDVLYRQCLEIQKRLITEGKITELTVSTGLLHDVIVNVAHNYGIPCHKEEFRAVRIDFKDGEDRVFFSGSEHCPQMYSYGIKRICKSLSRNGLVIVSVKRNFNPESTNHSVLLVGFKEGGGFYYHDPDSQDGNPRLELFVSLDNFRECWEKRRLAIFIDHFSR